MRLLSSGLCKARTSLVVARPCVAAGLFDGQGRFGQFAEVAFSVPSGQVIAGRAETPTSCPAGRSHGRRGGSARVAEEDA